MCLGFKHVEGEKKVDKMWRKNHRKHATHHFIINVNERVVVVVRTKRSVPPPPPKTRARKVVK